MKSWVGAWEGGQGTLIHVRSAHQQFTEIYWVELQECKVMQARYTDSCCTVCNSSLDLLEWAT